jgi:hypothetical protein
MSTQYEQFVSANQSLVDCFANVPAEQYSAMSRQEQEGVCSNEAASVRTFLANDSVNFRHILAERIAAFDAKPAATEE